MALWLELRCSGLPHPSNGCSMGCGDRGLGREFPDSHQAIKDGYAALMQEAETLGWKRSSKDLKFRCPKCAAIMEELPPSDIAGIAWAKWEEAIDLFLDGQPAASWGGKNGLPTAIQFNNARNRYPEIKERLEVAPGYKPRAPRAASLDDGRWEEVARRFEAGEPKDAICTGADGWPTKKQWNVRMEKVASFRDRINGQHASRRDEAEAMVDMAIVEYERGEKNLVDLLDRAGRNRWFRRLQTDQVFRARVVAARLARAPVRGTPGVRRPELSETLYDAALAFIARGGTATDLPGQPETIGVGGFFLRVGRDPVFAARYSIALTDYFSTLDAALDWIGAVNEVRRGGSIRQALKKPGRPNVGQWVLRRRKDATFSALVDDALDDRQRALNRVRRLPPEPLGTELRKQLSSNDIYSAVNAAVSYGVPRHIRDDVISSMVLAVLEGELQIGDVKAKARSYMSAYHRAAETYRTVSADAPSHADNDRSLLDTFSNEDGLYYEHGDHDGSGFEDASL